MIKKFLEFLEKEQIDLEALSIQEVDTLMEKHSAIKYLIHSLYHHYKKTNFDYTQYFESWSEEHKTALKIRKTLKAHRPKFTRYLAKRFKRLDDSVWRKPKGLHNKKRKKLKAKGKCPKIGYGAPALVRYCNNKGYFEKLCFNVKDIENINPMHMIRISGKVGLKNKLLMEYVARTKKRYVINPIYWNKYL